MPNPPKIRVVLLLSALLMGAISPFAHAASAYLRSSAAAFSMTPEGGVQYALTFMVEKPLGQPVYAVFLFENPEKDAAPLRTDIMLSADATEFSVKSERLSTITNNKKYLVQVLLYSDASHSKLMALQNQKVLFAVPKPLLDQVGQQYAVRID